jgi:putative oxidoreductase
MSTPPSSMLSSWGVAILRVTLGVIFVMHGYLALVVLGPGAMGGYTIRMGYPPALAGLLGWYLIVVHLVGGLLLVVGRWTRWAALAQVPIMASALFLYHLPQGFFLTGIVIDPAAGRAVAGGFEYVLLVLAGTVALILTGGGALALDGWRR